MIYLVGKYSRLEEKLEYKLFYKYNRINYKDILFKVEIMILLFYEIELVIIFLFMLRLFFYFLMINFIF